MSETPANAAPAGARDHHPAIAALLRWFDTRHAEPDTGAGDGID
jgi:hypothetical protein